MQMTKAERNKIYLAIAKSGLDPAECDLEVNSDFSIVNHVSGSYFQFNMDYTVGHYHVEAIVTDGGSAEDFNVTPPFDYLIRPIQTWAK
jgi:hypothetical protein